MTARHLALASVLALGVPAATLHAQAPWPSGSQAYQEGLTRGVRAGDEDSRRGQSYDFTDESDYRRADAGYRTQYGHIDRYRDEFRRGFETGYRTGFTRSGGRAPSLPGPPPRYDDRSPYDNRGRYDNGRGPYGPAGRRDDLAYTNGYGDGYERGLDDGEHHRRMDPIAESRYRNGDRGFEWWYGPREIYKLRYREAFRSGYERGYQDARRSGLRPWWWPW